MPEKCYSRADKRKQAEQSSLEAQKTKVYTSDLADEMVEYCATTGKTWISWAAEKKLYVAITMWRSRYPAFAEAVRLADRLRVQFLENEILAIGGRKDDHKAHQFLLSATSKYKQKPSQQINNNLTITEQIATATPDQLAAIAKAIEDRILALPAEIVTNG